MGVIMKKKNGILNQYKGQCRVEIQKYCEEKQIGKDRFHLVHISKWENIYDHVTDQFIDKRSGYKKELHWLNTNGVFRKERPVVHIFDSREQWDWILQLPDLLARPEQMVYLLVEEGRKFWIFEGVPDVVAEIIYEGLCYEDYYITDRKYEWMITCNHHLGILFAGKGFNMKAVKSLTARNVKTDL